MWDPFQVHAHFDFSSSTRHAGTGQDLVSSHDQELSPEKRLLCAVMEQAIRDYLDQGTTESLEAGRWIFEDRGDDEALTFSFSWICRQLDLEKTSVRGRITEIASNGVPKAIASIFRRKSKQLNG